MERVYYYIDESGDLNTDPDSEKIFLIGCAVTDDVLTARKKIKELKEEILESAYLSRHWLEFKKNGFHASTNHPDIYALFVRLLNTLNFRGYFIFINKKNKKFRELLKCFSVSSLYDELLKTILVDRLIKNRDNFITINIEQNLPKLSPGKIKTRKMELRLIIKEAIKKAKIKKKLIKIKIVIFLKNKKEEPLFCVVDYMSHIISRYFKYKYKLYNSKETGLKRKELKPRQNYYLIEKKIGLLQDYLEKKFYPPRKGERY